MSTLDYVYVVKNMDSYIVGCDTQVATCKTVDHFPNLSRKSDSIVILLYVEKDKLCEVKQSLSNRLPREFKYVAPDTYQGAQESLCFLLRQIVCCGYPSASVLHVRLSLKCPLFAIKRPWDETQKK